MEKRGYSINYLLIIIYFLLRSVIARIKSVIEGIFAEKHVPFFAEKHVPFYRKTRTKKSSKSPLNVLYYI